MKKFFWIFVCFVVFLLVVLIIMWIVVQEAGPTSQQVVPESSAEVSSTTTEGTENPVSENIPDLNPAANTNPFSDVYKNPFE